MKLSLRWHIYFTIFPLLLLLLMLGGAGAVAAASAGPQHQPEHSREYRQHHLHGRSAKGPGPPRRRLAAPPWPASEQQAKEQFDKNWDRFKENLDKENGNITVEGEARTGRTS